jgi:hypothetical protein
MALVNAFLLACFNAGVVLLGFILLAMFKLPIFIILVPVFFLFGRKIYFICGIQSVLLITYFKNFFLLFIFNNFPNYLDFSTLPLLFGFDFIYLTYFFLCSVILRVVKVSKPTFIFFTLILLLGIVGVFNSSILSFIMYSRFYLVPIICLVLGLYLAKEDQILEALLGVMIFYILFLIVEVTYTQYYELINANAYVNLKYYNNPIRAAEMSDFIDRMGTTVNGWRINRLVGPQFHPISVGYSILAISVVIALYSKRLFVLLFPLLLMGCFLSSKGALAAVLCFYTLVCLHYIKARVFVIYTLFMYGAILLILSMIPGFSSGFEHFMGLKGALSNVFHRPIGLGIGAGGTMSTLKGPEYGGESGFGTILSHLGFFAIFLYGILFFHFNKLMKKNRSLFICAAYLFIIFINSFLQEEALAPSSVFIAWLLMGYFLSQQVHYESFSNFFSKFRYRF